MSIRWTAAAVLLLLPLLPDGLFAQDVARPFGLEQRVRWTTSRIRGTPEPPPPYRTESAFPRLTFKEPLEMDAAPIGNRLFVAERYGRILSFVNDAQSDQADVFLDLGKVIYGFAFHPKFQQNGHVFVTYVVDPAKEEPRGTRLTRFTVPAPAADPPRCDPATEKIILEWPSGGHNGGCLRFGPDGMLYVATGDSSGIADQLLTGQDLTDLSGAILRIDVDRSDAEQPYAIPRDNPFVGVSGARAENWAYGLRQPWKMHFDRKTGDLWTGNVGQDLWEQVFVIERGGNYGWSVMEGDHPFRPERPRGPSPFVRPIVEHDHAEFRSITGGVVYHGARLPELRGAYIYGDYDTGKIWMLRYDRDQRKVTEHRELVDSNIRIVGFAEDRAGEFYLVDHMGGGIHRLAPNPVDPSLAAAFPRRLSETGLFSRTATHQLAPGVLPYSVIVPQWCDGATKERFFALPGDSQIEFETVTYPQPAPGSLPGWRFPDGAVIAETISLDLDADTPSGRRRLETRVLHYEQLEGTEEVGNQFWRGYTYVWNDDQTDAVLLDAAGVDRTFTIADRAAPGGKRSQTWRFPSRAECTVCHNMAAKYVLGLNTIQVNRDHDYGRVTDNQLRTFDHLGLFTSPLATPPADLVKLADCSNGEEDLDRRARSYLHANCSHCHRKWGGGNTEFQLLASLPLPELGIAGTKPAHGSFFVPDAEVLAAHDPLRSVLFYRMAKLGPGRMPRLGSDVVDQAGVQLIHDWIAALPSAGGADDASRSRREKEAVALQALQPGGSEQARQAALEELLGTTSGALQLTLAIDAGRLAAPLREQAIARATASPDAHVRDLFEKFLPEEQRPKRLGNAIKPETILALAGDAAQGRRLFFDTAGIQCKTCHKLSGQGTEIGPDLSQIGKKYDRARILDNILTPSREIDPKYVVYLAATADGRLHSGLLVERTEQAVALKDSKGNVVRLAAADIEQIAPQQQSLMPDLLLRDMTARQVADLLAFLASLK
jgi:putative heme-binding domain-containing protein